MAGVSSEWMDGRARRVADGSVKESNVVAGGGTDGAGLDGALEEAKEAAAGVGSWSGVDGPSLVRTEKSDELAGASARPGERTDEGVVSAAPRE
jgi:predicted glycosyltransferase